MRSRHPLRARSPMTTPPSTSPESRRLARRAVLAVLGMALMASPRDGSGGEGPASTPPLAVRVRKPVALALSPDGRRLYAANRRSGSLSVIDTEARRVVDEHDLGRGLA